MQTEIEAKWLNVDFEKMRQRLKEIGAELIYPERQMTRKTYDSHDRRLETVAIVFYL